MSNLSSLPFLALRCFLSICGHDENSSLSLFFSTSFSKRLLSPSIPSQFVTRGGEQARVKTDKATLCLCLRLGVLERARR